MRMLLVLLLLPLGLCAQSGYTLSNCHSHNDYERRVPFYEAFVAGMGSIEADIFLVDGELYVAHDRSDIKPERTLRRMYIEPVAREMALGRGSCYGDGRSPQLLIDLKSGYEETLPALIALLNEYGGCFDTAENPGAVRVVVSGSMPPPEKFGDYHGVVFFDGRPTQNYNEDQLRRLGLMSASLGDHAKGDGRGGLTQEDVQKITAFVRHGHSLGLKVRFWGCPDTPEAWEIFMSLGVDIINTDRPAQLAAFIIERK